MLPLCDGWNSFEVSKKSATFVKAVIGKMTSEL